MSKRINLEVCVESIKAHIILALEEANSAAPISAHETLFIVIKLLVEYGFFDGSHSAFAEYILSQLKPEEINRDEL